LHTVDIQRKKIYSRFEIKRVSFSIAVKPFIIGKADYYSAVVLVSHYLTILPQIGMYRKYFNLDSREKIFGGSFTQRPRMGE